jgi:hypothetical protein
MSSLVTPARADTTTTSSFPSSAAGLDALGDVLDALDVADGGAAVFLDDSGHGGGSFPGA